MVRDAGIVSEQPSFPGGDGSAENPYQIETASQLNEVRNHLDAYFVLTNDVDLSSVDNWVPIGSTATKFRGNFDGGGFRVEGLTINRPDIDFVGLFGYVENAVISSVTLEDVDITGGGYVGGLVGYSNGSTITESSVAGRVEGRGNYNVGGLVGGVNLGSISTSHAACTVIGTNIQNVGGLVGSSYHSEISESYATGEISSTGNFVGGLAGESHGGSIRASYATGSVSGNGYIGGLAGIASNGSAVTASFATGTVSAVGGYAGGLIAIIEGGTVNDSYARGAVSGSERVGGLVGQIQGGSVSNSYSTGAVSGSSLLGGLVGFVQSGTVTDSYFNSETSGQSDTGKGEPRTTDELKQQATFTDWDFTDTWKLIENATAPYLRWQKYFVFDGVQVQLIENERDIKAGHVVTPGSDVPATRVQSTVADQSAADIEGLHGRWMAVTRAGSTEMRAVAATDGDGESRTWFEVYNAQTEAWEKGSTTLALDSDAFEAGNEIVIEEDDEAGLQIRIETQVTRELHF